jgi:hypothetical protein
MHEHFCEIAAMGRFWAAPDDLGVARMVPSESSAASTTRSPRATLAAMLRQ